MDGGRVRGGRSLSDERAVDASWRGGGSRRVAMLLWNSCKNDSRVVKEAEALSRAGHVVVVFCLRERGLPDVEVRNGVTYERQQVVSVASMVRSWLMLRHGRQAPGRAVQEPAPTPLAEVGAGSMAAGEEAVSGASVATHRADGPLGSELVAPTSEEPAVVAAACDHHVHLSAAMTAIDQPDSGGGTVLRDGGRVLRTGRRQAKVARRKLREEVRTLKNRTKHHYRELRRRRRQLLRKIARARVLAWRVVQRFIFGPLPTWLPIVRRLLGFRLVHRTFREAVRAYGPDVVHAHDLITLRAGHRLAQETRAALVYDTHELALHLSRPPARPIQLAWAITQRRLIGRADAVITVCDSIAHHLSRQYGIPKPLVLHNSPPASRSSAGRTVREDLALSSDVPLVLYLGAIAHFRGVDVLVDALGQMDGVHLVVVGPRRPPAEAEMRARAEAAGAAGRFHILDPVPIEVLTSYVADCDIAVIPYQNVCLNHDFCMPNKLFESVLAGLPVAVADLTELRNFVSLEKVGVVMDERTPSGIAAGVRDALARKNELAPTGPRRSSLEERYAWEAQAAKLVELYRELRVPSPAGFRQAA